MGRGAEEGGYEECGSGIAGQVGGEGDGQRMFDLGVYYLKRGIFLGGVGRL